MIEPPGGFRIEAAVMDLFGLDALTNEVRGWRSLLRPDIRKCHHRRHNCHGPEGPTVQGKTYDLTTGEGERIWMECLARAAGRLASDRWRSALIADAPLLAGYGAPVPVRPRLGQRSFRVAVLDSYGRRCAITNEKTLPALEAAHIRDYHDVQEHAISNGILFRADVHKLFDSGYVTVTPDYRFEVSRRIKEEFENGRDYYALHGSAIRLPHDLADRPSADSLIWHNEQRFLG